MEVARLLANADAEKVRSELVRFIEDFMTPAFGSLPKREIDLRVFQMMRELGVIGHEPAIYSLMTDLKITRTKAAQLVFDFEVRRRGGNRTELDEDIKKAIAGAKFAKDGNYFVMEIENPLILAHMRQRIRDIGHFSDTSFNSALVRAPLDTITDLMLDLIPKDQHKTVYDALVKAGAQPKGSAKAVVKEALKTLGSKVVGKAADQIVEGVFENAGEFLKPLLSAVPEQIGGKWPALFRGNASGTAGAEGGSMSELVDDRV